MRPQPLPGNGRQRRANGRTGWRGGRAWPGGPAPGSAGLGRSQTRVRWSRACGEAGRAGRGGAERGGSGQRAAGTGGTSRWEPPRGEAAREGARRRALRRSPVRGARSRCAPGDRGSRAPRLPGPYLRRPSGARSPQRCRAA